jgi:hypothetical protein
MGGYADAWHPDFSRTRAKAQVFRTETVVGYGWRWSHRCRWRGRTDMVSYPLETWDMAFGRALEHLKECL